MTGSDNSVYSHIHLNGNVLHQNTLFRVRINTMLSGKTLFLNGVHASLFSGFDEDGISDYATK